MQTQRMIGALATYALAAWLTGLPLPAAAAPAVPARGPAVQTAQTVSPQFLPWPPAVPDPAGGGRLPFAPTVEPGDAGGAIALRDALAAIQAAMDRLRGWLESLREAAAAAVAQIVLPLPIGIPAGASPAEIVTQLAGLPELWRSVIAGALTKLQPPDPHDAVAARHAMDIAGSAQLTHEAATIAAADQQIIAGLTQQEVATSSTQTLAAAAARDAALPATVATAESVADGLVSGGRNLPSSRAGIELLVAAAGSSLRSQAELATALADRLAGLMQQSAQLSGQVGGLASTIGMFTERQLQHDRDALDARLGLADAARGGSALLQRLLLGAGEPGDEIRIAPLY